MSDAIGSVDGPRRDHNVQFFGLSTCVWCRKTRRYLEDAGVAFTYTYLDLLHGEERAAALKLVREWNPDATFPTLVIDEKTVVKGYQPDRIKELLKL